jgi:anti-sigma factor RsiW
MSCENWSGKLDAYVDGQSPDTELESHLRECPKCAREVLSRWQMKRATQAAAERYAPSSEFRLRVQSQIAASRATPRKQLWGIPRLTWAAAGLVAVVLLFVLGIGWNRHAAHEQALAELLDLHVAALASANPVDVISTDRHTVKPWFQGKLPFTFNLPDLQNTPYTLLGGRMMYFEHNPGAQLLYQTRNHKLSVFVFQDRAGAGDFGLGISSGSQMAFHVESWSEGGLRFAIVSDAGAADVHALGELLRAAGRS